MIPATAYPAPLPLGRNAALELLTRVDVFDATGGEFLTFVQIPVEERVGEWRFAGASRSLAQAVRRVEEFAGELRRVAPGLPADPLRELLDNTAGCESDGFVYPRELPVAVGCPHRIVVCVQYGAPYEGLGAGVVEVESVAASSFAGVEPQTDPPEEWEGAESQ
ncbi:hypothetical protein [Gemmata sp.]|uniref:hypothetical protein n=1 Tax=Gemmata sp. TaxID=1914242 RepID=UPI003F7192F9